MNFYPNPDGPANYTGCYITVSKQTIDTLIAMSQNADTVIIIDIRTFF